MNLEPILENALKNLSEIRERYLRDRWIFIPGNEMKNLVLAFGATEEDIELLQAESENLEQDPTLPFRRSRNGRYYFIPAKREIYRTVQQPFVLSAEEDFVRHDSGMARQFAGISASTQRNSTFQALLAINALIVEGSYVDPRSGLNYASPNWITTAFHLRTKTTPEIMGEPALEGVHQDGVDHTMTIFLGAENMSHGSAITRLHSNEEISGIQWGEHNPQYILGSAQHWDPLDTLIVIDHERKHSVSSVAPAEYNEPATRDMLILFTRKPVEECHISHEYDSIEMNDQDPLVLYLPENISS